MIGKQVYAFGKSEKSEFINIGIFAASLEGRKGRRHIGRFTPDLESSHVCKADCGLCSGAVLSVHKAAQCDGCEMWIHNECSFITEAEYENVLDSGCTWICPKCEFFNFSDSFFVGQLNLMNQNRFDLTKGKNDRISSNCMNQTNAVGGMKFITLIKNSIRSKKMDLLGYD